MEIEFRVKGKHLFGIVILFFAIFSIGYVYGLGGNTPSIMGHSAGEINFSEALSLINVSSICLNGDCKSDWPAFSCPSDAYCTINGNNISCPDESKIEIEAEPVAPAYKVTNPYCSGYGTTTLSSKCYTVIRPSYYCNTRPAYYSCDGGFGSNCYRSGDLCDNTLLETCLL